jgi:CHAT domain-containing protein
LLVEYMLAEPYSYAWVVTSDAIVAHRLAPRPTIEAAVWQYMQRAATPPATSGSPAASAPTSDQGARVTELLLAPLGTLPARARLLVVAPGVLQQLPFAALRMPGTRHERLIARHEIVHAPSASIVAAERALDRRAAAPRTVAVFADPVFDRDDPRVVGRGRSVTPPAAAPPSPLARAVRGVSAGVERAGLSRLPFTRLEADAIAALVPPRDLLKATGFAASLRTIRDPSLANYRIIHFATHGLLDTRTPELSGLVLSLVDRSGRAQEGFLRVPDITRLRLNADLAVLSGCETALGRRVEGEGVIGLTRAFVLAGAHRVIASLWQVDDLATAELMKHFYRAMLVDHQPPAAALGSAQRALASSSRWADPFYWAGLTIQGEWR